MLTRRVANRDCMRGLEETNDKGRNSNQSVGMSWIVSSIRWTGTFSPSLFLFRTFSNSICDTNVCNRAYGLPVLLYNPLFCKLECTRSIHSAYWFPQDRRARLIEYISGKKKLSWGFLLDFLHSLKQSIHPRVFQRFLLIFKAHFSISWVRKKMYLKLVSFLFNLENCRDLLETTSNAFTLTYFFRLHICVFFFSFSHVKKEAGSGNIFA